MHPVMTRYLNLSHAAETLRKQPATPEEAALFQVAQQAPHHKDAVLNESSASQPAPETQQALVYLATHAALEVLSRDGALGPLLTGAREELEKAGATFEEQQHLLASLLVEEAFGYLREDESFDAAFFAETLKTLPGWACLTPEKLEAWTHEFELTAPIEQRRLHREVAEQLYENAWAEGPEPINPEHIEMTLAAFDGDPEAASCPSVLEAFLGQLSRLGVVGPLRQLRLQETLHEARHSLYKA